MVGTFYAQPEPGAEPYVRVGSRVTVGPDRLHHRGNEDHERDRGRGRRCGPRGVCRRCRHRSSTARCSTGSIRMADSTPPPVRRPMSSRATPAPAASISARPSCEMIQRGASDLLLKAGRPPTIPCRRSARRCCRWRRCVAEELKALAESLMTPRQYARFRRTKEADFGIGVPGIGRFRTNVYQQRARSRWPSRSGPSPTRCAPSASCCCRRWSEEVPPGHAG